ncbi:hypothetical protein BGZ57DRAFT_561414 [Hyaloscypha finlandica]|nr:hypothetical protein BGZ57DRAFT_561414 [Hyaloscypha finlandica]
MKDNIDLKNKIVEVIASFNSGSSREYLEIELIEDESVSTIVRMDPSMLRQVISNLLTNAIEHSKERLVSIRRKQSTFLLQHLVLQIHIGSSNFQMGPFEARWIWKTVSVMIAEDNLLQGRLLDTRLIKGAHDVKVTRMAKRVSRLSRRIPKLMSLS